ncbi:MAG: helix-turn-helix domain-containing protein [Sandaracinus sp.]|nr:citrate synthase family protein [Myxococcales bacterium]MCB9621424.1 helix-turn-helix domain-containing protein [Sandaracinus sp.]
MREHAHDGSTRRLRGCEASRSSSPSFGTVPRRSPSRFDSRPPEGLAEGALLDARAAMAWLGVKRHTLYTYVSRGWLRRYGVGARSLYLREDLERLARRRDARAGHAATAAGALRWGEPVIDTALVEVRDERLFYRGVDVLELVDDTSFEEVATFLWTGERDATPWKLAAATQGPEAPLDTAARLLRARLRDDAPDAAWMRVLAGCRRGGGGFAEALAARLGLGSEAVRPIERAAIVIADHELNASTFAVRVAASTGASRAASLVAGLCAFSGPRHGTSSVELEKLADEVGSPRRARAFVTETLTAGRTVPGFAHPLYPHGDVRSGPILDDVRRLLRRRRVPRAATLVALCDAMRDAGTAYPRIDLAFVTLATALEAPPSSASWLFAVGRGAGWLAHAREQASRDEVLRPRARYVGSAE